MGRERGREQELGRRAPTSRATTETGSRSQMTSPTVTASTSSVMTLSVTSPPVGQVAALGVAVATSRNSPLRVRELDGKFLLIGVRERGLQDSPTKLGHGG